MSIRNKLVRLAYEKPALRPHLLPLLKEAGYGLQEIQDGEALEVFELLAKLSTVVGNISMRLDTLEKKKGVPSDSRPLQKLKQRLAKSADSLVKASKNFKALNDFLEKEMEESEAEHASKYASAVSKFLRTVHPLLNRVTRWVRGPAYPEAYEEISQVSQALKYLEDSLEELFESYAQERPSKFVLNPKNLATAAVILNAVVDSTDTALGDIRVAQTLAQKLQKDLKLGTTFWW